ncbi:Threonine aldolase [Alkaliphilus metalliredigens QYMF]|uniref:Threonine aldolase n=1 Tax=Alkaliphilus metalliredigens (strain QYMF) TaxID=293826 RepID=A6TQY1_ALKMQ|nr:low-specificity L-threonine aldolase [Alkaliphilus metalliredigens]ABR48599.1 Threonine aldolase [Alkaliphilus metalliredigens QYMF]
MKMIDLRSDTVTLPSEKMLQAIQVAQLGDDVYGDDVTTNELEALAANITGKEAGLFVPTGTMGNLIAVMTHTKPGQEIILEESCHIYLFEVGGIARIAGVQARPIQGSDGKICCEKIQKAMRTENIHFPETGLICLENTHNMAGGTVVPLENMKEIYELGQSIGVPIHLDGARVFNAATHLGVQVKEIAQYVDSMMFCLSKGLGAPIGSMLVGSNTFISQARKYRKMLGGGMRQVGVIAAPGRIAIEEMVERLELDHKNAKKLAEGLNSIKGVSVELSKVHTNIVNVDFSETGLACTDIVESLKKKGILANVRGQQEIRFVTHKDVTTEEISNTIKVIKEMIKAISIQ